jgi:NADH-quinone oxidoreductase subunit L
MAHVHESPKVMILPLFVLAAGAIGAGLIGFEYFVGDEAVGFWGNAILVLPEHTALENAHHVPLWVKYAPLAVGAAGIALAYVFYLFAPGLPAKLAATFGGIYRFLMNKWYFDELYDFLFVRPAFAIGRGLWRTGDGKIIDGFGPDGISAVTLNVAQRISRLQTGYVYHYAFAMLIGVVFLISWYWLARAG